MVQPLKRVGRPQNLYIEATQAIKDAIFRDTFRPGETLPSEKELSAQLGVSRPVLREALRALETQGFLEIRRGSRGGAYVTDLSNIPLKDNLTDLLRTGKLSMSDLTQARLLLEPEVFRLAAINGSEEQFDEMDRLLNQSLESDDRLERIHLDARFHRMVAEASGSALYLRFMQIIFDFVEVFSTSLEPEDFQGHNTADHQQILGLLRRRESDQASTMAREHAEAITAAMVRLEKQWLKTLEEEK